MFISAAVRLKFTAVEIIFSRIHISICKAAVGAGTKMELCVLCLRKAIAGMDFN